MTCLSNSAYDACCSKAGYIPRWFTRSHMVTHPSTNRAWHRVTSLIETNALPLSHATSHCSDRNAAATTTTCRRAGFRSVFTMFTMLQTLRGHGVLYWVCVSDAVLECIQCSRRRVPSARRPITAPSDTAARVGWVGVG